MSTNLAVILFLAIAVIIFFYDIFVINDFFEEKKEDTPATNKRDDSSEEPNHYKKMMKFQQELKRIIPIWKEKSCDKEVIKYLKHISKNLNILLETKDMELINKFTPYYLSTTVEMVNQYISLVNSGRITDSVENTMNLLKKGLKRSSNIISSLAKEADRRSHNNIDVTVQAFLAKTGIDGYEEFRKENTKI